MTNIEEIENKRNTKYTSMKEKMSQERSKEIYRKRLSTVEPVFALIEDNRGFTRFTVWEKEKVKGQWSFVCFVHNLQKIMKYGEKFAIAA